MFTAKAGGAERGVVGPDDRPHLDVDVRRPGRSTAAELPYGVAVAQRLSDEAHQRPLRRRAVVSIDSVAQSVSATTMVPPGW